MQGTHLAPENRHPQLVADRGPLGKPGVSTGPTGTPYMDLEREAALMLMRE